MKFILALSWIVVAALILSLQSVDVPAQENRDVRANRLPQVLALDSSGNGYDGVNQGSPIMGLPGRQGTAYSFDKLGSWTQIPPEAALNPYGYDFLVSAWVNFTVAPPPNGRQTFDILRKGLSYSTSGVYKLEIVAGGRIKCSAKDSEGMTGRAIGPDTNLADGHWHRVGCARTGSTWSAIVDETVISEPVDLGSIRNTMPMSIGSKYGFEDLLNGRLDEVSLIIGRPPSTGARRRPADPRAQINKLGAVAPTALWHLDETESAGPRG